MDDELFSLFVVKGGSLPSLIVNLLAVQRLAGSPGGLPSDMERALAADPEYARFGAVLRDLPWYGKAGGELARLVLGHGPPPPPMLRVLRRAPVELGLTLAEMVSRGAMVGREAGLAVLCGYFTHLALERRLGRVLETLMGAASASTEEGLRAARGIEWVQGLLWARETLGSDLVGTPALLEAFRIQKRRGYPFRGLGRGLSLLVRSACFQALGTAPEERELDRWVKGFWIFGRALASPLAKGLALPAKVPEASRFLYRSEGVDVGLAIEKALGEARETLSRVHGLMVANDFSDAAKHRLQLSLPGGGVQAEARLS